MHGDLLFYLFVTVTFLFGGVVKGVIGVGLPTFTMGLLSLTTTPARAAALLLVPTLVTNIWQALAGPRLLMLARRLWLMLLGICIGTWAGAGVLTSGDGSRAITFLGVVLVVYALIGLSALRLSVPARMEPWLSPLIGAMTGAATA